MRLEEIVAGSFIAGLEPAAVVTVRAVSFLTDSALQVIYKTPCGAIKERLLTRADETSVSVATIERPWSFQKLLWAFLELPKYTRSRTVMEVSGYPHYENVASNILAFYFNPSAEHGLKDLLISAFLRMAGRQDLSVPSRIKVQREFDTGSGRLDLLLESDVFLIAIENKIFHWLANDLEQYTRATKDKANVKAEIRVVLGLKTVPAKQLKGGFVSFTYDQLWQQVQVLLGRYIQNANPKWVTYLMDFMETTTNLAGSNMELSKTDRFFIEQHELVDKLFAEHEAFLERLKQRLQPLCDLLSQTPESEFCAKVWVCYAYNCVVLDFVFDKTYKIACDVGITPHGWKMTLFNRPPAEHIEYLRKLASQLSIADKVNKFPQENGRYVIQKWDLDTDYKLLCSNLCSWIKLIVEASKTLALQSASSKLEVPPHTV